MCRALWIAAVTAEIGVALIATVAPSKTVADMEAPKSSRVIYGLHVAQPDDMRNFPPDLVPLP